MKSQQDSRCQNFTYMSYNCAATLTEVAALRRWLQQKLEQHGIPTRDRETFLTAISELAVNAIKHPQPPARELQASVNVSAGHINVELRTDAASFSNRNALLSSAKNLETIDPFARSGRGLLIVIKLFPQIEYRHRNAPAQPMECYSLSKAFPSNSAP